MNKLMLATAVMTALCSGSLMEVERGADRGGRGYPPSLLDRAESGR